MLENLAAISGAYPIIRAGGSTQNRAIWVQNQTEGIIPTYSNPGAEQPSSLTIGPNFLQSFQIFPKGTQYIFGLSFQNEDGGTSPNTDGSWSGGERSFGKPICYGNRE